MRGKRNWTVEDNVVALYVALYGDDGLVLSKDKIRDLIEHTGIPKKAFPMRVQNYRYIVTDGKEGLSAGYQKGFRDYKKLYFLFKSFSKDKFREYVNLILKSRLDLEKAAGK